MTQNDSFWIPVNVSLSKFNFGVKKTNFLYCKTTKLSSWRSENLVVGKSPLRTLCKLIKTLFPKWIAKLVSFL